MHIAPPSSHVRANATDVVAQEGVFVRGRGGGQGGGKEGGGGQGGSSELQGLLRLFSLDEQVEKILGSYDCSRDKKDC